MALIVFLAEPVTIAAAAISAATPPESGLTYLQGAGLFVGIPALATFLIAVPFYGPVWWRKIRGYEAPEARDDGPPAADEPGNPEHGPSPPAAPGQDRAPRGVDGLADRGEQGRADQRRSDPQQGGDAAGCERVIETDDDDNDLPGPASP